MNVNVRSLQYSVQVIIPQMRKQGRGGVFLQTSSTAAYRPRDQLAWYSASKAAVSNASKALAIEFAAEQIRFVCVNPVIGGTGMRHLFMGGLEDSAENRKAWEKTIPMGRFSTPEDIANACCYLGSDEAGFITGIDFFGMYDPKLGLIGANLACVYSGWRKDSLENSSGGSRKGYNHERCAVMHCKNNVSPPKAQSAY